MLVMGWRTLAVSLTLSVAGVWLRRRPAARDDAVEAPPWLAGQPARVIMQFATTAPARAAFNRLLDRGAAVRAVDNEARPGAGGVRQRRGIQRRARHATARVARRRRVACSATRAGARHARRAGAGKLAVRLDSTRRLAAASSVAIIDSGIRRTPTSR